MTDRIHTLTVVLEKDMREDDAKALIDAIQQMRNVLSVSGVASCFESRMAEDRARRSREKRTGRQDNGCAVRRLFYRCVGDLA